MRAYQPGKAPVTGPPRRRTDAPVTTRPDRAWLAAPGLLGADFSRIPVHTDAPVTTRPDRAWLAAPGLLGADFSRIPVHTDSAARSATERGARAYTPGTRVVGGGIAHRHTPAREWRIDGLSPAVDGADVGDAGLPESLKASIEHLSGVSLADVKVHYNSSKPAQVQAWAYTQGTDIHLGPGQEQHLPHEAWHVVQQKRRRVPPTLQAGSVVVNDDPLLEAEADEIGVQAASHNMATQADMPKTVIPGQSETSVTLGPTTASSNGQVVQRTLKMGVRDKGYRTLVTFKKSEIYQRLIPPLNEEYGEAAVELHLSQLFSADHADFYNELHFEEALRYDLQTKSMPGNPHTLQEQYMTRYGWAARSHNVGAGAGQGAPAQPSQLKVYRTMPWGAWERLAGGDYSVLEGGHLGDFKQAQNYLHRGEGERKALVEFTLKPGVERTLFSSETMAFPRTDKPSVLENIKTTLMGEGRGDTFREASLNEGMAKGLVGMKAESGGESGFSFGIAGGGSAGVFMKLVQRTKVVSRTQ